MQQIYLILTGSFSPLEMDIQNLKQVRLAGEMVAHRETPINPADPDSIAKVEMVYFREDGTFLLHTISYKNGSFKFIYTLEGIQIKDMEPGGQYAEMSLVMDDLEGLKKRWLEFAEKKVYWRSGYRRH